MSKNIVICLDGTGLRTNIGEAHLLLMRHWEPGDRIFLFAFRRRRLGR